MMMRWIFVTSLFVYTDAAVHEKDDSARGKNSGNRMIGWRKAVCTYPNGNYGWHKHTK